MRLHTLAWVVSIYQPGTYHWAVSKGALGNMHLRLLAFGLEYNRDGRKFGPITLRLLCTQRQHELAGWRVHGNDTLPVRRPIRFRPPLFAATPFFCLDRDGISPPLPQSAFSCDQLPNMGERGIDEHLALEEYLRHWVSLLSCGFLRMVGCMAGWRSVFMGASACGAVCSAICFKRSSL
jgi:hypothetical protein